MELANIAITVALISTVLATSVSLAEPAGKGFREANKERDRNEETERRNGTRKDREKLEAEQGAIVRDLLGAGDATLAIGAAAGGSRVAILQAHPVLVELERTRAVGRDPEGSVPADR